MMMDDPEEPSSSWEGWVPNKEYDAFRVRQKVIGRPIEHAVYSSVNDSWYCYIPAGSLIHLSYLFTC